MKTIEIFWQDQNTLIFSDSEFPRQDDWPMAVLVGGRTGPISSKADELTGPERQAFLRGVIQGVKHCQNVLSQPSCMFGADEIEHRD